MIDIHSHILPEIDDGSMDMSCSVEMAEIAVETGVTEMIATPHSNQRGCFENYASYELAEHFENLRLELKNEEIPLKLYLGMEVFGTHDVPQLYREGKLITLNNSRYMLIEFDFYSDIYRMERVLYGLLDEGCVPLIAHPERYIALQEEPEIIGKWIDDGMATQVNKGSLSGRFGRGAKRLAHILLADGNIHCVASDAHGAQMRTPDMSDTQEYLAVEASEETAELLLHENPKRIIMNLPLLRAEEIQLF